jgi:hypothetical protein
MVSIQLSKVPQEYAEFQMQLGFSECNGTTRVNLEISTVVSTAFAISLENKENLTIKKNGKVSIQVPPVT